MLKKLFTSLIIFSAIILMTSCGGMVGDSIDNASDAPVTNNPPNDGPQDTTAPTPGNNGTITAGSVTYNSLVLNWEAGSDTATAQLNLVYAVYYSTSNNIGTVADCEINGTPLEDFTTGLLTYNVTGLSGSTTYYFNVVMRDSAGNKACYAVKQQTTTATPDTTAPTPGNSGIITTSSITHNSLILNWTAGSDNVTSQLDLQYAVYQSASNNISTVATCESNGTLIQNYTSNLVSKTVTGLSGSTTYYFNVIVRDSAGNKACYAAKQQITDSSVIVYCAGYSVNSSGVSKPVIWKNETITQLTPIDSTKNSSVNSIYVSGSDVYCAGSSYNSLYKHVAVYWKNGILTQLTPIDSTRDSKASSIYVSGSDVYCAGYSKDANGCKNPVYWKNGIMTILPPALTSGNYSEVSSICVSGSDVYCVGYYTSSIFYPAFWKNKTRTTLSRFASNSNGFVYSIYVSGSDVYCAGDTNNYASGSGISIPAYWKNGIRTDLTPIDTTKHAGVSSIYIVNQ